MPKVLPTEDVRTLSEFRANTAAFVNQVKETRRPLILTQHGRSAAVLLDVKAYEDILSMPSCFMTSRSQRPRSLKGNSSSMKISKNTCLSGLAYEGCLVICCARKSN